MKRAFFSLVLLSSTLTSPLLTEANAQAPYSAQAINQRASETFYTPAYAALAEKTRQQSALWAEKTCTTSPYPLTETDKAAFFDAMRAWARVNTVNFGPITSFLRRDRLYHWPERRNAVGKALAKFRTGQDLPPLEPTTFARSSVAIQGFPALERLLSQENLKTAFDCELVKAITQNIATISSNTAEEWEALGATLRNNQVNAQFFETQEELVMRIFTELLSGYQMITDQKLALPLGSSLEKANGKRAESWRSDFSTQAIQETVRGLADLAHVFIAALPAPSQETLNRQLLTLDKAAQALPLSLKEAVSDPTLRPSVEHFLSLVSDTHKLLANTITHDLNLSVGFNSLDGD